MYHLPCPAAPVINHKLVNIEVSTFRKQALYKQKQDLKDP